MKTVYSDRQLGDSLHSQNHPFSTLLSYGHGKSVVYKCTICNIASFSTFRARRIRKVLGGSMRQSGIVAAAGVYALDNCVERLVDDHRRARKIGYGIIIIVNCVLDERTNC